MSVVQRRRRPVLLAGLVLLAGALVALTATEQGAALRARTEPFFADLRRAPAAEAPLPAPRTAVEDGRTIVRLSPEERAQVGLVTEVRRALPHRQELQAYGLVLDLARVTELTNAYLSAKAQLQQARARAEVSGNASRRAKNLGPYATPVQVETAEGTYQTDQAALMAAESQLRTLAATAQQEWGPVIGKAIVERAPAVTRLIERTDFLMQVTLPPGESVGAAPGAAFAEVPPQSDRVALRFVSPATRTDPRIQGQSFYYLVSGESGLLPGMSTLAFLPSERTVTGVLVPEDAVVHGQGGTWVYRAVGEGAYVRHPIRSDPPMSDDAYVAEGLADGTEIVLKGGQALLSEELKSQIRVAGDDDD
ncbi:efflux RND transporter periplasmic adaptor subunit [Methylobacterium dankookense]|uniref:efflux RND transporter periplasmic adaptor subunit n=1 Tax=Methylobacterium dankookense TaxID=560405 RepID=UPI001EDD2800|nr:efflux RND transporter periplasmic adaptor subunit [Methylobacterium dankookense]